MTTTTTVEIKTLTDAINYIYHHIPYGGKSSLETMYQLLTLLDNPQQDLKVIHVAGTNGKGSTSSFLFHILKEANLRVGLFTSPYIQRFNERVRIGDAEISDETIISLINRLRPLIETFIEPNKPGPFEILTAMAFLFFKESHTDVVILEVGVGGLYDPTNVIISPLVSVITAIDYDHMDKLGSTLSQITSHKGGIIKENCPVVVYPQAPDIINQLKQIALSKNSPFYAVDSSEIRYPTDKPTPFLHQQFFSYAGYDASISILGDYQVLNACVAIKTIEVLITLSHTHFHIEKTHVLTGLNKMRWAGRLEVMPHADTLFLLDGAHNTHGLHALLQNLKKLSPANKKYIFIIGMLRKKDYHTALFSFIALAHEVITVQARSDGAALSSEELSAYFTSLGVCAMACTCVEEAITLATSRAGTTYPICAFGSLYYIGQVRDYFNLH